MHMKKPLAAVGLIGLMALAACGGGGTTGATGQSSSAPSNVGSGGDTGSGQDPTAKGPVTIAGAKSGGTVTVLTNTGLSTTIDPTESYYTDTSSILSGLITRSLTQYKYDPSTKQMVLVPDLATDLGQHNANYTVWKFTIRPGVKWQDGTPVTAAQVKWGIDRSFDRPTFPTGASYSNDNFLGGCPSSIASDPKACIKQGLYDGPYSTPNVPDKAVSVSGNVVTIRTATPFPDMPYWGAFPAMGAVPTGNASSPSTYKNKPLSDGPYEIKSYTLGKDLTLVKNPQWSAATDPGRTQYPTSYVFQPGTANAKEDAIMLADSGSGKSTLTYDDLLSPDYNQLKSKNPSQLNVGPSPCTYYFAPDYSKITDIRVRRALGLAYPYKDVILASGLIPGVTGIPAGSLMPPGTPGQFNYNPTGEAPGTTDAAKAKQLLQQAGKLGFQINFLYRNDDPIAKQVKDVMVQALTKAGFKANPIGETTTDYVNTRSDINGPENVRSAGWCSDWPSGGSWFPVLLKTVKGQLGNNFANFSEPAVDKQISQIQHMPSTQQPAAWGKLDQQIAQKYYPMITTYYTGIAQAHGSSIVGDNDDSVFGMPTWKDIYVQQ